MADSADAATPTDPRDGGASQEATRSYRERLYTSWWTWPLPLVMAVLLAAMVHMGYPGVRAWLPYLVLIPLVVGVLLWLGNTKIEIADGELWVGDAHLPVRLIDEVDVIDPSQKRKALGPDLDPAAFVVHRPWVRSSVRVWLDDEDDPTPYWVISTRRPHALAARLRGD